MQTNRVWIYGAGGFAREVAWLVSSTFQARDFHCVGYVDDSPDRLDELNGLPVRSFHDVLNEQPDVLFAIAVGDPATRRRIADQCENVNARFATLSHRSCEKSEWVTIGDGSIVCAGTILTVNIDVGKHVHINLDCTVGHDVSIGSFTTISPGVHISGNVRIEEDVYIGTGANIINGTREKPLVIGHGSVIGAGSCVTTSLDPGGLYVGVPAALKKKFL